MKINIKNLPYDRSEKFFETIDFSRETFNPYMCRGIFDTEVSGEISLFEDIVRVTCLIKTKVIAVCSYTLEDVTLSLSEEEEFNFTKNKEDEDNIYFEGNIIDFDKYIRDTILASIPTKVIKEGAKKPQDGSFYKVLDEDELKEESSNSKSSPFDKLDSLFDDDD